MPAPYRAIKQPLHADPRPGPAARALRFHKPLTLAELRATGCDPECFGPGTRGRIFPVSPEELVGIVQAAVKANPDQGSEVAAWLRERS